MHSYKFCPPISHSDSYLAILLCVKKWMGFGIRMGKLAELPVDTTSIRVDAL